MTPSITRTLALLVALLLPAIALAGDPPSADVQLGKTVSLSFNPGFKLSCPHFACVFIDDDAVIQPDGAPFDEEKGGYEFSPSKKTKFKFTPLTVGSTDVTVQYKGTEKCPGTAFVTLEVTVTPDLKLLVKEVKTETKLATKLVKEKLKLGLKFFCDELDAIEDDYKDGFIDACEAQWEAERLAGYTLFGLGAQLQACLTGYSLATAEPVIGAALDELLEELQRGACGSLFDSVAAASTDSYAKFTDTLDKKIDKVLKRIMKEEDDYAFTNLIMRASPSMNLARLPSLNKAMPQVSRIPAGLTMASGLRKAGGRSLTLAGIGDLDADDVIARITDSNGNSQEYEAPLSSLPAIGGLFGSSYPFDGDDMRTGVFVITVSPTLVGPGDDDPGSVPDIDAGGPFLVELLYPGDTHPCFSVFVSVP